ILGKLAHSLLSTLDASTDTGGSPGTDDRPCTRAGQGSRQRAGAALRPRVARRPAPEQARKRILTRLARRPGASQQPDVPIELDVPWRPPVELDGSGAFLFSCGDAGRRPCGPPGLGR